MKPPLESLAASPDQIRRDLAALEVEVRNLRDRRNGVETALKAREQKMTRLQASLAMSESGAALPVMACG